MVSPELLRRYPFFRGLRMDQIVVLAKAAEEMSVCKDFTFFKEGEELHYLYLVVEGEVGTVMKLPQKEVIISTVGTGDVFGWSALVPPTIATAATRALTPCRVVAFDCKALRRRFEDDCLFGYIIMQNIAQVIRKRLQDLRLETLAYIAE